MTLAAYPTTPAARTAWILARRGERHTVSEERAVDAFVEEERTCARATAKVATIFLTNRECPWKCVMCDLWRNTITHPVAPGAIPGQIRSALATLPSAAVLKLYNSGSFFDSGAIPPGDWPEIAALCAGFDRVILECHPRLIGPRVLDFRSLISSRLEIALGLETAHPEALSALNKRITPADFARAAAFLKAEQIDVRTFLLIHPPFISPLEQQIWLDRSVHVAFAAGSGVVSLIPSRAGNGALDDLSKLGSFSEPNLDDIENAQDAALRLSRGVVLVDLWDMPRFAQCDACLEARTARIRRINQTQSFEPRLRCSACAR